MKRKEIYTLNVGLNDNPKRNNLKDYFSDLSIKYSGLSNISLKEVKSTYNGGFEPTAVITFNSAYKLSKTIEIIENAAKVLNQECIPLKNSYAEIMVYNPYQVKRYNIKTGNAQLIKVSKTHKFNNKYFKESMKHIKKKQVDETLDRFNGYWANDYMWCDHFADKYGHDREEFKKEVYKHAKF